MLGFGGSVNASCTGGITYNSQVNDTFRGLAKIVGLQSLVNQGDEAWILAMVYFVDGSASVFDCDVPNRSCI